MTRDSDLLYALLALQMGFITKESLVKARAVWASNSKQSLASISVDEDVRKSLLGLSLGDAVKGTLLEVKAASLSI